MQHSSAHQGTIAYILPWPSIGGTELQTLRLAEAARTRGYSTVVYVPDGSARVRELFEDRQFPVFDYQQVEPSYSRPGAFIKHSRALASGFRQNKVKLMHAADISGAYYTGLAGRLAGAKVVSHVRNHYPALNWREKGFLLPVEHFVFVSQATRKNFALRSARHRATILYDVPGIEFKPGGDREAALKQFGIASHHVVFGMASRVSPQKDFPTLIRAAQRVIRELPNSTFLIAGDYQLEAPHREHYQAIQPLLDEAAVRNHFCFAGFQSDMAAFFAATDIFVLSSNWEGLPTVALEAMLYSKPLVCSDVGGISEAIEDGVNGMLVPPKASDVMASKLLQIANDRGLAERMAANARLSLDQKFGDERFRQQINELYSRLLGHQ
jgi:glycosyltransferase involved in cell wall biosynthesis